MRFLVAQQLREPIGSSRSYKIEESLELEGCSHPVKGEVDFLRTSRGILVKGRVLISLEAVCSRCLCSFLFPLNLEIEEEFYPTVDPVRGYVLPPYPDAFTIDERQFLDLTEALRQNAISNMPIKFLCRPDCAGLCPQCGANLNEGPCLCLKRG